MPPKKTRKTKVGATANQKGRKRSPPPPPKTLPELVKELPVVIRLLLRVASEAKRQVDPLELKHKCKHVEERDETVALRKVVTAMQTLRGVVQRRGHQKHNVLLSKGLTEIYQSESFEKDGEKRIKDLFIKCREPLGDTAEEVKRSLKLLTTSKNKVALTEREKEEEEGDDGKRVGPKATALRVISEVRKMTGQATISDRQIANQWKGKRPSGHLGQTLYHYNVRRFEGLEYVLSEVFGWPGYPTQEWPGPARELVVKLEEAWKQADHEARNEPWRRRKQLIVDGGSASPSLQSHPGSRVMSG